MVLKVYFNVKVGTQDFVNQLIAKILDKIKDQYLHLSINELKNFLLILCYLKEEVISVQKKDIYAEAEKCILRQKDKISYKNAC